MRLLGPSTLEICPWALREDSAAVAISLVDPGRAASNPGLRAAADPEVTILDDRRRTVRSN
jgi:hypothetical protein